MIYYEVKDKKGRIVVSSVSSCPEEFLSQFLGKEAENLRMKNARNVYRSSPQGSVRLIVSGDSELQKSNRTVSRIADVYLSLLPEFKKIKQSQRQHFDLIIKRFIHNLVEIQKRLKSSLEKLAPDSVREGHYEDLVKKIEENITKDPHDSSDKIGQIVQRTTDFDAQVAGLRVISGLAEEISPSIIRINILNALFRFEQPYERDFEKKGVNFKIVIDAELAEKNRIPLDPSLLNVVFSQFFNNAVKYVRPDTNMTASAEFANGQCLLRIEMQSTCIDEDEVEKIFEENYKGRHSGDDAGDGIGMFTVRRALKIMGAHIKVLPDSGTTMNVNGRRYCQNIFIFEFKL